MDETHTLAVLALRELLENILPKQTVMMDFELEQTYPGIGLRTMLLHAREIRQGDGERMILLAVNDITKAGRAKAPAGK